MRRFPAYKLDELLKESAELVQLMRIEEAAEEMLAGEVDEEDGE